MANKTIEVNLYGPLDNIQTVVAGVQSKGWKIEWNNFSKQATDVKGKPHFKGSITIDAAQEEVFENAFVTARRHYQVTIKFGDKELKSTNG